MLPGFIDPHTHVVAGAIIDNIMDNVGITRFSTVAAVLDYLKSKVATTPAGEWILARNFDPSRQAGPDALTFAELDGVSRDVPVFVLNASGHLAYGNRKPSVPPSRQAIRHGQSRKGPWHMAPWEKHRHGNWVNERLVCRARANLAEESLVASCSPSSNRVVRTRTLHGVGRAVRNDRPYPIIWHVTGTAAIRERARRMKGHLFSEFHIHAASRQE